MRAIVAASRHLSRVRARWARESDACARSVVNSAPTLVDADVNAHVENARPSLETVESAPSPSTVPRLPAALRTTAQGLNALSPRDVERTVRASLRLARQHVGEMDTFDVDVERALRRATRDVFDASNGGVRVGRRVGTRAERLLKALRARSGGYVMANGEDGLEPTRRALERSSSSSSADDNAVAAWDDDITWGARLSRRKLRRVETGLLASSSAAVAKENVNSNSGTSLVLEERDAAVYAVMRSPMKMAALKRIFYETRDRIGDGFKPKSVLDFGSGPVPTTMMALRDVFGFDANVGTTADGQDPRRRPRAGDAELCVAFVDSNPEMMRFARRVVGYAEREREDREEKARITAEFAALESSPGDSAFDDFADDTVAEDGDGITRLDFTDFEATDEKPSTRPASAFRLKVPHPWHEAEGVRTTATLRGANRRGGFDVVVCSYALGESFDGMSSQRSRDVTVRQLWERVAPGGILVISEPGTPKGSLIVRRARHLVLEVARREMEQSARRLQAEPDGADVQAYVVAPCQHDKACPVKDEHREDGFSTWCHFPQRALRSSYYREIKQSAKPYQDEKFSYVVLRKMTRAQARQEAELATKRAAGRRQTPNATANDNADNDKHDDDDEHEEAFHAHVARESSEDWSRVIRHPHKRKGHVVVELCTSRGELERATIAKSHGQGDWAIGADGYKFARKLRWGDLWPYANKTTIAPGDQKHFMLEAAAFEEKYLADLRASDDPSASLPRDADAIADDDVPDDSTFFAMLDELDAAVSNTSK